MLCNPGTFHALLSCLNVFVFKKRTRERSTDRLNILDPKNFVITNEIRLFTAIHSLKLLWYKLLQNDGVPLLILLFEAKMVDYSLQNWSLKDPWEINFWAILLEDWQSQFSMKIKCQFSSNLVGLPSKINLLQCYQVLCIDNIDTFCILNRNCIPWLLQVKQWKYLSLHQGIFVQYLTKNATIHEKKLRIFDMTVATIIFNPWILKYFLTLHSALGKICRNIVLNLLLFEKGFLKFIMLSKEVQWTVVNVTYL